MGTLAGTAIIDYRLYSLPTKEKQRSISRFRLQQTNGSLTFMFSVCRKQMEIAVFFLVPFFHLWNSANVESWTWRHGDMDMERSKGKSKPRQFSLIHIPFAHHAKNRNFVICPFVAEEQRKLSVCKQTKWTKRTCPSAHLELFQLKLQNG
jgi:hypothetical protein